MFSKLGLALVLVSAAIATPACMVGPGDALESDDPTDEDLPPENSEAALSNNARTAFNYFVNKGFTEIQAAGIVGNLMQESSVRPTAVELGGGPGRGIAQWSLGGRWNRDPINLVSYANARGLNRWALTTQLDFIWHELNSVSSFGLADLRRADTLQEAVIAFQNKYERCGACAQGRRMEYATDALNDYGTGASGTGTGSGGGGNNGTEGDPCYSDTLQREMPENACVQSRFDGLWYQCDDGFWGDRWSNPNACVSEHPL
ncbi:MAG: phage tail tip lysozyme [Kofleriaceae bacterium]|nr:phage tail tip lysozyme [Kofleriaceae bacterium]